MRVRAEMKEGREVGAQRSEVKAKAKRIGKVKVRASKREEVKFKATRGHYRVRVRSPKGCG